LILARFSKIAVEGRWQTQQIPNNWKPYLAAINCLKWGKKNPILNNWFAAVGSNSRHNYGLLPEESKNVIFSRDKK
jgi:hypothetical protein